MTFALAVIAGTPLWVWPLLAFTLWGGLVAARTRETGLRGFLLLPLFVLLALNRAAGSEAASVWAVFAASYGSGIAAGYAAQGRWILYREPGRVKLAGEWWTMAQMLGIFAISYLGGVLDVVRPDVSGHPLYSGVETALIAAASGAFVGRGLRVLRAPMTVKP